MAIVERLRVDVEQGNFPAFGQESLGGSQSDAARGAGYHRCFRYRSAHAAVPPVG
jgi:hypothetical protein